MVKGHSELLWHSVCLYLPPLCNIMQKHRVKLLESPRSVGGRQFNTGVFIFLTLQFVYSRGQPWGFFFFLLTTFMTTVRRYGSSKRNRFNQVWIWIRNNLIIGQVRCFVLQFSGNALESWRAFFPLFSSLPNNSVSACASWMGAWSFWNRPCPYEVSLQDQGDQSE